MAFCCISLYFILFAWVIAAAASSNVNVAVVLIIIVNYFALRDLSQANSLYSNC